jgi:hypothetical protein
MVVRARCVRRTALGSNVQTIDLALDEHRLFVGHRLIDGDQDVEDVIAELAGRDRGTAAPHAPNKVKYAEAERGGRSRQTSEPRRAGSPADRPPEAGLTR